tara:strand:+ start:1968 stop:2465 length:498 start_codon:yes stop_codon:yes gene_type:complete
MKLNDLLEEFKTGTKDHRGNYAEIFVNPTGKEMDDVSSTEGYYMSYEGKEKKLRFTGYDKKVYVFPVKLFHGRVEKLIGVKHPIMDMNRDNFEVEKIDSFEGVAVKKGNRWVCIESDLMEGITSDVNDAFKYFKKDFNYINKYIDINTFIEKTKNELRKSQEEEE